MNRKPSALAALFASLPATMQKEMHLALTDPDVWKDIQREAASVATEEARAEVASIFAAKGVPVELQAGGLVAVSGDVAAAGAVVYWTMRGPVEFEKLSTAWGDAGFDSDDVCDPPDPNKAAHRAVNEEKSDARRMLSRPLEGHKGRALVKETASDRDLDYDVKCTTEVDAIGRIIVECEDDEMKSRIEAAYKRHLFNELSTSDVSGWIVKKLLPKLDAVPLRFTGGFYFIPKQHLDLWQQFVDAIRSVSSHSFFRIPAMHTEDCVEAILAGVGEESRSLADVMWSEIKKGALGERGLNTKAKEAEAMRKKIERYSKLLGLAMPDLVESMENLEANLGACALKAAADEDYSDMADLADLANLAL